MVEFNGESCPRAVSGFACINLSTGAIVLCSLANKSTYLKACREISQEILDGVGRVKCKAQQIASSPLSLSCHHWVFSLSPSSLWPTSLRFLTLNIKKIVFWPLIVHVFLIQRNLALS